MEQTQVDSPNPQTAHDKTTLASTDHHRSEHVFDPELSFVSSDGNGSSSNRGSGGGGRSDDESDDDPNEDDPEKESVLHKVHRTEEVRSKISAVTSAASDFGSTVSTRATSFVKTVPAPVTVAMISSATTLIGSRVKARRDKNAAEKQRIAASKKRRSEIEKQLRQLYAELAAPMLKSAAKLAERLYLIVDSDWTTVENEDRSHNVSAMYSAYLLGRYLAAVEVLKHESALLDYGFHTSDRILSNILGRVQGILCANDDSLIGMQQSEHYFLPGPGDKPVHGGLLKVPPRVQTAMGELMLRRLWTGKYDFVDAADNEISLRRGPRALVTYLEFSSLMEKEKTVQKWFKPVVKDFEKLEQVARKHPEGSRRRQSVGARVYFLQSGLLDLVEFFDPLPHAKSIPCYRRRRLQIGPHRYTEEQRAPPSLHKLYRQFANIRDHRVVDGDLRKILRLPHLVEVYVGGAHGGVGGSFQRSEHGDCPFSHRVLIALEEMGIPYKPVIVPPDAKPAWYYLLHPENKAPCIYHDGDVVEDSGHIVSYLSERFPTAKKLASTRHLKLTRGTPGYTRFHPHFIRWMSGDASAKKELEEELIRVNKTVETVQLKNDGQPFFGGETFSREDTAIAPMLHNVDVAGRMVKNWKMPKECTALRKYLEEARKVPSFVKTVAKDETIAEGYGTLKERGGERAWKLADMPE